MGILALDFDPEPARALLSLASSAKRRTPPLGVAPSFAISIWRPHSRASSTRAEAPLLALARSVMMTSPPAL
jgi:hypothetical protein